MDKAQRTRLAHTGEYHYRRQSLSGMQRRQAIRQGFQDYQHFGWAKDPPFPEGDARRWMWQDGAEMAEKIHTTGSGALEETRGWQ